MCCAARAVFLLQVGPAFASTLPSGPVARAPLMPILRHLRSTFYVSFGDGADFAPWKGDMGSLLFAFVICAVKRAEV